MDQIRLGRTELYVSKTAFGALPIQRISHADAVKLVRRAYESGINYFDTANAYTDSEEKLAVLRATYVDEDGDITKDSNSCLLTYELQEMTAGSRC